MSTLLYSDRYKECEYLNSVYVCVQIGVERERGRQKETHPIIYPDMDLAPPPPHGPYPVYCSLLILPKHIVLFALHVLKVKVAPGHTFVDVLDVIASGLEVSGGVVGP